MSHLNNREQHQDSVSVQPRVLREAYSVEGNPYLYWLYAIDGIGKKTIDILIERFGTAEKIYRAPEQTIARYLKEKQMQLFRNAKSSRDPVQMYEKMQKNNIRFIPFESRDFPEKLREIPDPPYALYVKGRLPDPSVPSVAIIGARLCSEYGRYMARVFGQELGAMGFQVISGMATGIDGIAEKAAFQAGGCAFSVLGSGVDVCYPSENRDVYEMSAAQGGLISEYVPGTAPRPQLFPPRNRIISGLADAVLVIEARAKSGTLITVDMALEQGREVYVLPGRVTDRLSDGCNSLLKQGALIATCAADIAESFYRPVNAQGAVAVGKEQNENDKHERSESSDCNAAMESAGILHPPYGGEAINNVSSNTAIQLNGETESGDGTEKIARKSGNEDHADDLKSLDIADPGMLSAAILYVLDVTPKTIGDIEAALARKEVYVSPSRLMCTMVDLELCGRVYREGGAYSLKY